jgi:hypothetical protein
MRRRAIVGVSVVLLWFLAAPRTASADWLLTGFVGKIAKVKTQPSGTFPAETFTSTKGFGVNLASAFPTKGNIGFELDLGIYNNGLANSDVFGTQDPSKLMSVSTNFFYSPGIPRVRPYFSAGPSFTYRRDKGVTATPLPSAWAAGFDAGGGLIVFANEHLGGRFDVRYNRNIGDFVALTDIKAGGQAWNNLSFWRVFVGATVVLH